MKQVAPIRTMQFRYVTTVEVKKVIMVLNKKRLISGCIPVQILKDNVDTILPYLTDGINASISNSTFPQSLKLADITAAF